MNPKYSPIEDRDLQAYVDGQLDQQRREEVEEWLAQHPEDDKRVQEFQQQNQAMHALFDPILSEPVQEDMVSRIKQKSQQTPYKRGYPLFRVAAMAGLMVLGGVIGYVIHGLTATTHPLPVATSLPRQAAIAHIVYTPEVVHPVEVTAEQETHLTKWLSKRLNIELRVPHLTPLGFNLVGGRLLPGETGPAAQFMYENSLGKRLTLYVKNVEDKVNETAFRFEQQNGVSVFYWIDGSLGYALSGEIDKQDLLKAANAVYQTLNL